jgi:hypothetical protein
MTYVARPGVWGRIAIACTGGVLAIASMGCSDSGNDGSEDAGADTGTPPDATHESALLPWTAIPVTGTLCRDASPTGYGVNLNPDSRKLLIYLEGGAACFNATSCLQNPESWAATDANLNGTVARNWILSRSVAENPFRDWNLVYIPYCSGDVHTGSSLSGYLGQPQVGFLNYKMDLLQIVAAFPSLEQVVLSGSSAGGFGVAWNWMWTQDAFGSVPVTALDDSGPPMGPEYLSECQQVRYAELWGWEGNVHPNCTECNVGTGKVVRPLLEASFKTRATTRFGLLSYDEDGTIKSFFAYGSDNCSKWDELQPPVYPTGKFPMGLGELRQAWAGFPRAAMYVVPGGSHTFLGSNITSVKTGSGIPMLEWIKRLINQSDGWTNVAP